MKRIGLVLVLVAACSESAPGVGEQDAELTCRAWCDPSNACGAGYGEPLSCLDRCMGEAEEVCGEHHHAKRVCELEMDCNDPFEDCKVHDEDRSQCQTDIRSHCAEQCPEANQQMCFNARGDCGLVTDCIERCPIDPGYCVDNGGDCGLITDCIERCPIDPGYCVDHGGQCGVEDWCHQECPPIDGFPTRPVWCSETDRDCERVDACAATCLHPQVLHNCIAGLIEPTDCQ